MGMAENIEESTQGAQEEARFVESMKRIREELGWSQGELARRMSDAGWSAFHQTTISRIEKGERPVRLGEARGIASALGALVGQMILPTETSKALRDLELACGSIRKSASSIQNAVEDYMGEQSILEFNLRQVREAKAATGADEWVATRQSTFEAVAQRWIDTSYIDVINEYFEERAKSEGAFRMSRWGDDGVDPEAS